MKIRIPLCALALLALATVAYAEPMYKCPDGKGGTVFRNLACPGTLPIPVPATAPGEAEQAAQPTIKAGWPVCVTHAALDQLAHASAGKDARAQEYLASTKRCLHTVHAIPVSVLPGYRPAGSVQVRLYLDTGPVTVWTYSGAIQHQHEVDTAR